MSFHLSVAEIVAIAKFHNDMHAAAPSWAKCPFSRCNLIKKSTREEWSK